MLISLPRCRWATMMWWSHESSVNWASRTIGLLSAPVIEAVLAGQRRWHQTRQFEHEYGAQDGPRLARFDKPTMYEVHL